jgi:rhodanese-related sulfurtransferase
VGILKQNGITNAAALLGGFEEWKREKKEVITGITVPATTPQ